MTTLYEKKTKCGVCGAENEYTVIGSTNTFGSSPDLDTRPPEMKRSTIFAWVQRCLECGYCASDIRVTRPGARAIVNSDKHKDQLNDPMYPDLANSFLCKAIIDRESKDFSAATWALIHAAWVCDDSNHPDQAEACRHKASDMLVIAEKHGQQVAEQEGASTAIIVDLLRRSGRIEQARQMIATRRGGVTEDIIARILDFQTALLDKNDVSCHTIAEALGEEN